jgi:hypothetical protein
MKFDTYSYLWPPRPDDAISPQMLPMMERRGFQAQVKKNGTCNVIAVTPEKGIIAKNRHKEDHTLWRPDINKLSALTGLPGKGWYVFVAELMHSKVKIEEGGVRDTNYIHDMLVCDGEYLVGVSQVERHRMLCELFGVDKLQPTYSHWVVDQYTWIARQFTEGFKPLYDSLTAKQDEGLVLKDPKAPLALCTRQASNNKGMLKSRKGHANYTF